MPTATSHTHPDGHGGRVPCRPWDDGFGAHIIANPEYDATVQPRDGVILDLTADPRMQWYALTNGRTYMPITRCPFCGELLFTAHAGHVRPEDAGRDGE